MPVRKYFPFIALEDSKAGTFVGAMLGIASSWQIEVECREKQEFLVTGGLADRDFGQWTKKVPAGESFVTPDALDF